MYIFIYIYIYKYIYIYIYIYLSLTMGILVSAAVREIVATKPLTSGLFYHYLHYFFSKVFFICVLLILVN